ncbi:hypothetical protein CC85DRAFT_288138 [Cutaneotrichosporon oleaginosum]|uniref:Uncharacterized protein n=1 Tax=Cutaneotrichosporon oleaginosum TaxID=879819 RepID=A0A0J0XFF2_9TREE|nr:uncharacterized protein CC85DRAFT_288138 [Cutaneotrichosporon oleaginosum]KLT39797.1 hypothetical protein CC85DRAFT_288138 [Cutaneotrichosporon oleaginosum]TXT10322.1 hypothetical protein COLE_04256 [Cutaneotrichosporon oleaginosum]
MAHPEAFADGPDYAEPLVSAPTKAVEDHCAHTEDSAELCEYIRACARQEPRVSLRISGDNGRAFDFTIDLGPVLAQDGRNIRLFSRPTAAYRTAHALRAAAASVSRDIAQAWAAWWRVLLPEWQPRARRHSNLHPPWSEGPWRSMGTGKVMDEEAPLLRRELRGWCEAYAADSGALKRFTLKKEVWGWDLDLLRRTVQHRIWASGQRAFVDVEIECGEDDVVVEPDNALVRLKHNGWVVLFAWITLLYPLLWVLLHLLGRHGATYDQAVASYALKLYPALPGTSPTESLAEGARRYAAAAGRWGLPADARLVKGPRGVHILVGVEESEWLQQWEERILQAVRLRIKAPLESQVRVLEENEDEGPEMCEV